LLKRGGSIFILRRIELKSTTFGGEHEEEEEGKKKEEKKNKHPKRTDSSPKAKTHSCEANWINKRRRDCLLIFLQRRYLNEIEELKRDISSRLFPKRNLFFSKEKGTARDDIGSMEMRSSLFFFPLSNMKVLVGLFTTGIGITKQP
jgi:hypothetical protein